MPPLIESEISASRKLPPPPPVKRGSGDVFQTSPNGSPGTYDRTTRTYALKVPTLKPDVEKCVQSIGSLRDP